MASLRDTAACIGVTGDFSVVRDFFGRSAARVGTYGEKPDDVSVLTQVGLLQGPHVHLNLIRVGIELYTPEDEADIDAAVQGTRGYYEQVGLGVGRVLRFSVSIADANGHEHIGSDGEAVELTHDWTVPNDAIDVFLVRSYVLGTGHAPINGPCDKSGVRMNGCVIEPPDRSGQILGHYVGQYLGLHTTQDNQNLMWTATPNGGELTAAQGAIMRDHCFVNGGC